jgi:hypothetical protein
MEGTFPHFTIIITITINLSGLPSLATHSTLPP